MAALALALLFAASQPSIAIAQSGTLTRAEARSMSPDALSRKLFGDLAWMMFAEPYRDPSRGGPLRALWFRTRPYRSGLAGVCQTDSFVVGFERALFGAGDDPPVRPTRVQVYDNGFFISDLALARRGELAGDAPATAPNCAEIDPRTVPIIVAGTEGEVAGAVQHFADLLDGARAGRVAAALECRGPAEALIDTTECLAMLRRYRAERIHVADHVPGCGRNAVGMTCERIETSIDDTVPHIEIVFETPRSNTPNTPPSRIRIRPAPTDDDAHYVD